MWFSLPSVDTSHKQAVKMKCLQARRVSTYTRSCSGGLSSAPFVPIVLTSHKDDELLLSSTLPAAAAIFSIFF